MDKILTDDELTAIRARAEAATPGPWEVDSYVEEVLDHPDEMRVIVGIEKDKRMDWWVKDSNTLSRENAEFIAHARTDIPALLAEVERLRKMVADLQDEKQDLEDEIVFSEMDRIYEDD